MEFSVEFYASEAGRCPVEDNVMKKTNFDIYLNEQLKNKTFAERFERAGAAWDIALQLAALRKNAGISQKELARRLKTSQQQISRLESPAYEGHSLSMLRRVAQALNAEIKVAFEPVRISKSIVVSESPAKYGIRNRASTRAGIARVAADGKMRAMDTFNPDGIPSVGYRANSRGEARH